MSITIDNLEIIENDHNKQKHKRVSYFNPNILVVNVDGKNMNLIDAMNLLFTTGIVIYGGQDLIKLKDILKLKTEITDIQEKSTIKIPTENIINRGE